MNIIFGSLMLITPIAGAWILYKYGTTTNTSQRFLESFFVMCFAAWIGYIAGENHHEEQIVEAQRMGYIKIIHLSDPPEIEPKCGDPKFPC